MIPANIRRKWRRTVAETRYGYYDTLTRRGTRLLRQLLILALILAVVFTFHDSRKPDNERVVRRENFQKQLDRRRAPRSKDPRVWPGWNRIHTIFAFGDSQTDTGFTLRGPQPDYENPIGNPAFPGRTGSYGANYLGHMTATYNKTFIKTFNMANRFSPFFKNTPSMKYPSFGEQIDTKFLHRYGPSTKLTKRSKGSGEWIQSESLFVLYVGPDDIMHSFGDELQNKGSVGMAENLAAYEEGMNKLYDAGARNFLLVGYPQLENAPGIKDYGDKVGESKAYWRLGAEIVQYNGRLAFMAHHFGEIHPDASIFMFNTHKLSLTVRLEPTRFPETSTYTHLFGYCFPYADNHWWTPTDQVFDKICTDGLNAYLWRDEFHYSEPFQKLMGKQMVELLLKPEERLPLEFY